MEMNQRNLIYNFNSQYREKFNPKLFERSEDDIIESILKIIKSAERENEIITFKIDSYRVVDRYDEIQSILSEYNEALKKKGKYKKMINTYEYINLKRTDIKLLIINYFVRVKEESKVVTTYVEIPRIVDKYYFRLGGNLYLPSIQIIDGSTFNSTTSKNSTSDTVTLKTALMSIKMYRNEYDLETITNDILPSTYFTMTSFKKTFGVFHILLAKYGYYGVLNLMNFTGLIRVDNEKGTHPNMYTFKSGKLFISVDKYMYRKDVVLQSLVCTLFISFKNKNTKYNNIFGDEYWKETLGGYFGRFTALKGDNILESCEGVYDGSVKEYIHLPYEYRKDIFSILRWMMTEFSNLMGRDNLDLDYKKVRISDYIGSLYGMKLATVTHKLADNGSHLKLEDAEKYMRTLKPTFLIDAIQTCKLINYKNCVNDLDSVDVLKASFKTLPGLGEKKNAKSSFPDCYRHVHPSHLARLDMDSSTKSDPGLSISLVPYCHIEEDGSFGEYEEPVTWDENFKSILEEYREMQGKKELLFTRMKVLGEDNQQQIDNYNESMKVVDNLMQPTRSIMETIQHHRVVIPLEPSGTIYYEQY